MGEDEKISWRSPYSCSSERDVVQYRWYYCQSERNACNQSQRNSKQMQREITRSRNGKGKGGRWAGITMEMMMVIEVVVVFFE